MSAKSLTKTFPVCIILSGIILLLSMSSVSAQETRYIETQRIADRGFISDAQWSPVDNILAVASGEGVWLYTDTLEIIRKLPILGNTRFVGPLEWSPDGKRIFLHERKGPSLLSEKVIHIWDIETGNILFSLRLQDGESVTGAAWHNGSTLLALLIHGEEGTRLSIIDASTRSTRNTWEYEGLEFSDISWNVNGTTFTVIEERSDQVLHLTIDQTNGEILNTVEVETNLSIPSPDGSYHALIDGAQIQVLDSSNGDLIRTLELSSPSNLIEWDDVLWHPDENLILAYDREETQVTIFDFLTGNVLQEWQFAQTRDISSIIVSSDGKILTIWFRSGVLELYDVFSGQQLARDLSHIFVVTRTWSPDSTMIATGGFYMIRIWDAQTGQEIKSFEHHSVDIWSIAWSPDNTVIATGHRGEHNDALPTVKIWDVNTTALIHTFVVDGHPSDFTTSLFWSPDSRVLVAVRPSNQTGNTAFFVWDIATGEEIFSQEYESDYGYSPRSIKLSSDGKSIATLAIGYGDTPDLLRIWDIATGEISIDVELPDDLTYSDDLSWHPSNQMITMADRDQNTLYLWDISTDDPTFNIIDVTTTIDSPQSIRWHPEGKRFAVYYRSGRLFDFQSLVTIWSWSEVTQQVEPLQAIESSAGQLTWSPDGTQFVISASSGGIIIYSEE